MMCFLLNYHYSNQSLESFLVDTQKKFIKEKCVHFNGQLSDIADYKERLYVYYILTKRIFNLKYNQFFKNGYNFGWLNKEKGFKSIFDMDGEKPNPIFQTYSSQFRYNLGLQEKNALPPEIVGKGRLQKPFDELKKWSEA